MILFLTSSTESLLYPATATMSLLRVGDISIHLTTTRFDLTFPYIPYSFSTWFSSPMTCSAYELCISHASLDLLRSLNQDQSSGGFSSAMADPDNKNKRTKTALLIMRISLMLITLSLAATLEWRRRSHVKGVRRPSAANYSDLLIGYFNVPLRFDTPEISTSVGFQCFLGIQHLCLAILPGKNNPMPKRLASLNTPFNSHQRFIRQALP